MFGPSFALQKGKPQLAITRACKHNILSLMAGIAHIHIHVRNLVYVHKCIYVPEIGVSHHHMLTGDMPEPLNRFQNMKHIEKRPKKRPILGGAVVVLVIAFSSRIGVEDCHSPRSPHSLAAGSENWGFDIV